MEAGSANKGLAPGTVTALVALGMAVFVVASDFTAIAVVLPNMEKDLNSDVSTIQWVINAYALVFGVFIITAGRLADLFGRREMFFAGATIFAVFSVLGGFGQEPWQVIACRVVMGFGGGMIWTSSLGMIYAALPAEKAGLAGGIVLGVAGIGNAAGPLLGGLLTEVFDWRAIFFLNLPVAVVAIVVTAWKVHQPRPDRGDQRLDIAGTLALSLGLVVLLVALDQVTEWGWDDPRTIALLALCPLCLAAFAVIERRMGPNALVPPEVMGNPAFRAVFASVLLMSAVFFVAVLYLPQYMQKVLGFGPLASGAGLLPWMVLFAVFSFIAGTLYSRLGAKRSVTIGATFLVVGLILIATFGVSGGYAALVPGMLCLGIGVGTFYSTVTTAGVTALDESKTSLAGGIVYMAQVAGGAVGLGIATTIFTTVALDEVQADAVGGQLPEAEQKAVDDILAGTDTGAQVLAAFPRAGRQLQDLAADAFTAGMQTAFLIFAAVAALGLLVALFFVGGRLRLGGGGARVDERPAPSG